MMEERICSVGDVPSGEARRFVLGNLTLAVVRIDDDWYAVGDTCTHQKISLSEGEVHPATREIECWKHGSCFSLETGDAQLVARHPPGAGVRHPHRRRRRPGGAAVSELKIEGLRAAVGGREILKGIDLVVRSGEVHAVMGPNGSGKSTLSHVVMGRPGYHVTGGSVTLDGVDVLALEPWERAKAGLYLAMQYPTEVPGVNLEEMLTEAAIAAGRDVDEIHARMRVEAARIGFDERFLERPLNVDLSGGEKKRNETLQLGVLQPRFAILDELDSGLDVDALRACSRRIEEATHEDGLGVLAITHYSRLLHELKPDVVHVLARGRIQTTGGPELAASLEQTGYGEWADDEADAAVVAGPADPFADPFV